MGITRRGLMAGSSAVVVTAGAGWWFFIGDDDDPLDDLPEDIEEARFEWSRDRNEMVEQDDYATDDPPKIQIDEQTDEVVVSGVLQYGSSTCDIIAIEKFQLDDATDELSADIGSDVEKDTDGIMGSCTDDLDIGSYTLSLLFDAGLPSEVYVSEQHSTVDGDETISNQTEV